MLEAKDFRRPEQAFVAGALQMFAMGRDVAVFRAIRLRDEQWEALMEHFDDRSGYCPRFKEGALVVARQTAMPTPEHIIGIFSINSDGTVYGFTRAGGNHDSNLTELHNLLVQGVEAMNKKEGA
jgi:hypothetical protein